MMEISNQYIWSGISKEAEGLIYFFCICLKFIENIKFRNDGKK